MQRAPRRIRRNSSGRRALRLVENKTGAAGLLAVQSVAPAPPDGYTLLLCGTTTHTAPSGTAVRTSTPQEMVAYQTCEAATWGRFIRAAGIEPE
ncbi:tripartite tricarboxylate transporter substrate-binding protein [Variovorax rhizosphaerae]|uniref:Tripartite tricarboxylate transporter substrate-binding protein n=1 Tax=Variovorax rhizosphaerae TaxID=1836200 RepID=A0ABU8WDR9_9BURK